jgi:hypothetical protein
MFRGALNDLLKECIATEDWRSIVGRKNSDKRMCEEEIALRYYAFKNEGLKTYRTPLKFWLNDAARNGRNFTQARIQAQRSSWNSALKKVLVWFEPNEAFRRPESRAINRALFDLVMRFADRVPSVEKAAEIKTEFRKRYFALLKTVEFADLISRSVDHTKRTRRRFELWQATFDNLI